jgi:DNA primase
MHFLDLANFPKQKGEYNMAKIAQASSKYIVHAVIKIEGVVDRPDVIGAIFGQTEGLLGEELELRELQKSGRIGRIEVNTETKSGKTNGDIIIPSSLDKAETAIIGAALEIIERIGPCNAKLTVTNIEDVRISKRRQVIDRAKHLLKDLIEGVMPDSSEIAEEVVSSVRVTEIGEYGADKLSAGPAIADSDEIIVVEGRADVLNLLKYGFKNVIAVGGTGVPKTIIDLCKQKEVTVFVDGDRGGELIIKELQGTTEIDFATKAPDGKEVEELTKKEIHKALRAKVAAEQMFLDVQEGSSSGNSRNNNNRRTSNRNTRNNDRNGRNDRNTDRRSSSSSNSKLSNDEKKEYASLLEDLIGTRGACVLDKNLEVLGKIPISELASTVKSLSNTAHAIVFDGSIDKQLLSVSEKSNVKYLIGMSADVKGSSKTQILTPDQLN